MVTVQLTYVKLSDGDSTPACLDSLSLFWLYISLFEHGDGATDPVFKQ